MKKYTCKFCHLDFNSGGHATFCDLNPNKNSNIAALAKARRAVLKTNLIASKEEKERQCKWCNKIITLTYNRFLNHLRWCELNPDRPKKKVKEVREPKPRAHSEETRKIISEKRKAYLAANKDKHNWSRYSNKESIPEKKFKEVAERSNIKLEQYYIPPESNRFFEIDFANVENKIAFEINGNQHYNSDGSLKEYYKNRQKYFIDLGWKPVEIHYTICFNEQALIDIIKLSFSDFSLCENKIQEINNNRIERKIKKENNIRRLKSERKILLSLKRRKVIRPSKEELCKMVWEIPTVEIAKRFGVSDNAIIKWCKSYGISKPPRGYWSKLKVANNA